jgi:hypothetical protein
VIGNVEGGNLNTAGQISATGNVTGNFFIGNGSQLTGVSGGNSFSPIVVSGQSNVTANSSATALSYVAGYGVLLNTDNTAKSITYALDPFFTGGSFGAVTESVTSTTDLGLITDATTVNYDLGTVVSTAVDFTSVSSNIIPSANITYDLGNATNQWRDLYLSGNTIYLGTSTISANASGIQFNGPGNAVGNITGNFIFGTIGTAAQTGITSVGTLSSLSVSGNVQGGNLRTDGLISATGSITGASVVGGIMTGSSVSVTGAVSGASVVGGIMTGTSVSVTGNATGGNVLTGGVVSATGNITGNYILGNGSQLTGISAGTSNTPITITTTTISANYTIATGQNGLSVGPMNTANGVQVTVANGQRWIIL